MLALQMLDFKKVCSSEGGCEEDLIADIRVYGGIGCHGHLGWRSENRLRRCWLELTFAVVSFLKVPFKRLRGRELLKGRSLPQILNLKHKNVKGRDGCQDPCLLSSWVETAMSVDFSDNMGTGSTEITSHEITVNISMVLNVHGTGTNTISYRIWIYSTLG